MIAKRLDTQIVVLCIAIVVVLVTMLGCDRDSVTRPPITMDSLKGGNLKLADDVFVAPESMVGEAVTQRRAHAKVTHLTACDVAGGNTLVIFKCSPVIGVPWVVEWTSRPTANPPPGDDYPPFGLTILAVSTQPVAPAPVPGGPGCMLQVGILRGPNDYLIAPQSGSMLTQSGGRVTLNLTPPPNLMGVTFYCQLLVTDFRNAVGMAVSPLLTFTPGV
jgi:hypothetical protein